MRETQRKQGFTLVELSIVLVILGLLVGGVLTGQSLIRAAELRSVTTQHGTYLAAVHSFRDKYFALPGDMTNAQSFWGVAHATPATCFTTASTTTATCNGNGDGVVLTATGANEAYRFWQHLANAGLIEGTYNGITMGSNNWSAVPGTNVPRGKFNNSGWHAYNWTPYDGVGIGTMLMAIPIYGNLLSLGGASTNYLPSLGIMKPEEMWNIDTKMDDGRPGRGKLVAMQWNNCTTATLATQLDANYQLSSTNSSACALIFVNQF